MTQKLSIRDLENLSGIKAHTIRIWEKRYNLFDPSRTSTNIRTYNPKDLKKLLNIVSVLNNGMKIGKATSLSDNELNNEIEHLASGDDETSNSIIIGDFIVATIKCDINLFDELYLKSVDKMGIEKTIENIVYPLLVKIGLMWTVSKLEPAQEHFTSQLIRQKLFTAIEALPNATSKDKYLLFLPQGEFHEIGLLYGYYLIKKAQKQCVYLGPNVPINGVVECVENTSTTHLLTQFVTSRSSDTLNKYLLQVSDLFKEKTVYISGLCELQKPIDDVANLQLIKTIDDLKKLF